MFVLGLNMKFGHVTERYCIHKLSLQSKYARVKQQYVAETHVV